jgi:alpha-beta hydrolase superfamily lysophospholipase
MESKPTVLFIHGSWHTPAHYAPICDLFSKSGYPTSCPLLASVGKSPPFGPIEDAQCIRSELHNLVEKEGKDVIVVAHSYGGVVASQAVDQELAREHRETNGTKGGVLGLLYMCAFLPPVGKSLESALGGALPPWIVFEVS